MEFILKTLRATTGVFLILVLFAAVSYAADCANSTAKVCKATESRLSVDSGGEIDVESGGALTVESGGELNLNGANAFNLKFWQDSHSFAAMTSGASVSETDFFPVNLLSHGCAAYVNTLITGATAFHVGDEDDPDEFHASVAVAADTVAKFGTSLQTRPFHYAAAKDLVLTAVTSDFTAGAVTVNCAGWLITEPTS